MENRCQKLVLEADEGITFNFSKGASGEVIIRASHNITANVNLPNYANPPIPPEYQYVCGTWEHGFVIERESDGSQFVWVPVGALSSTGTLDGEHFSEKFGRRNYQNDKFSECQFDEPMTDELLKQIESVNKYGGFYISRYNISANAKKEPQSVKGVMPWVNINFDKAKEIAADIERGREVKSHLPYGAEYDSIFEWLIKSNAKTFKDITSDSTDWGNYSNAKGFSGSGEVLKTGSNDKWCANNIYDLAGNVSEWSQEQYRYSYRVNRGGWSNNNENYYSVSSRGYGVTFKSYPFTGFRVALYIK